MNKEVAHHLEGGGVGVVQEGPSAGRVGTETDGCPELRLTLCDAGIVPGQLLSSLNVPGREEGICNAATAHHNCHILAIGSTRVAQPGGKVTSICCLLKSPR